MRAAAIVTGVLGLGTVLVFGAAALAATMFPSGGMVAANPGTWLTPGGAIVKAVPPGMGMNGGIAMPDQGPALPGSGVIAQP